MVSLWAWAFGGVLSKFFHLGLTRRTIFDEAPSVLLLTTGLFAGSFAGAGYVLQDIAGNRMELLQRIFQGGGWFLACIVQSHHSTSKMDARAPLFIYFIVFFGVFIYAISATLIIQCDFIGFRYDIGIS
ncbi:hypothetical protein BZA70DRAFT_66567 [Myxozyma melibiosi]|uniref:Chitin synthase export chaperone n=1 Tax=Myxozyma melibiosi TaxID=54550 RepID=A0ABR1F101_9ASCO